MVDILKMMNQKHSSQSIMYLTMKRLESLRVERERVIKMLGKEKENQVKLLIKLMDVDDEIQEIQASAESG
ncbi:hypothetical protein UF75_5309 [Desulfosporosinus sp. I2]|uniref:hypothetical protein n=1 Tax=Desulfosporosinus sp. I2 TaxID=1617025 RepID=UPI0005F06AAB|nr:hypothetical protein [Desulfosporosinus sp. I2]KJR44311.1 hypothetical protein UF75_5309 [Desulfosporosinus sp. I2]